MVLLDERSHHLAISSERANRRALILAHQATVAFDIRTQDRRQLALQHSNRLGEF
jgi:hypothetical protein